MKFIPNTVTRTVATAAFKTQQASPTLLFAGGVVGVVGTVILASKATLKLEEVLEETNDKLADVKALEHSANPKYSEKDAQHDKVVLYTDAVVKIAKLYAPSVLLGAVSIGMLAGSHRILTKRNAALTAAYTTLEKGFDRYRARVRDELGEEKDREFLYGTQTVTVEDESGKKTKKKVLGDGERSMYSVIYDQLNVNWQGIPELDRVFLEAQQEYATHRLRARGHLLLNDVYDSLGFPRTTEGCVVGWKYGSPKCDGYVDFGFGNWPSAHDYIHARERGVILDFNVDGIIYDKI